MNGEGDRRGKGKEKKRKRWMRWKWKGEWSESEKVNEVNGELGEFDEYAANGKKVKRSKGQKWLFVKRDGLMPVSWLLLMPVSWIFWYKISSIYNKVVLTRVHY